MVRNLFGILLALAGAALAAWSPFTAWYGGRLGRDYQAGELFTSGGITATQASLWTSLFAPMLGAAVLAFLAALLRSRLLTALLGIAVLGFTVLWMVRQGQQAGGLTAGGGGLGEGPGYAIGGAALLLMGSLVMRGRRARGRRRKGRGGRVDEGYGYDDYGREYSEAPDPYGPFGAEGGGHGAYLADEVPPGGPPYGQPPGAPPYAQPPGRPHGRDPYFHDDTTPPQEWDPWAAGAPDAPPRGAPPGGSADEAPQGPQQQPPAGPGDEQPGPYDTQRQPRRGYWDDGQYP